MKLYRSALVALLVTFAIPVLFASSPNVANGVRQVDTILRLEVAEMLRAAKADFIRLKTEVKGNYQAEQTLHHMGEIMGNVDNRIRRINEQIMPPVMSELNGQGDGGWGGGGGQGGEKITAEKMVSMIKHAPDQEQRMAKLRAFARFIDDDNGPKIMIILAYLHSEERKIEAARLLGSVHTIRISVDDIIGSFKNGTTQGSKLRAEIAKALLPRTTDLTIQKLDLMAIYIHNAKDKNDLLQYGTQFIRL